MHHATFGSLKGLKVFILSALPNQLLESLKGVKGYNRESFVLAHEQNLFLTSIRINPAKISIKSFSQKTDFLISGSIGWNQHGLYLGKRPSFTFDPLFHAGCYYVQDASSMFIEQALKQLIDLSQPLKILDLCAAPGGKSTLVQSLLSPDSLLVCNEVIRGRANILKDNLIKWGSTNVLVTNNDPIAFQKLPGYFDCIVVDAPCSGSGLFRKDKQAIEEWSTSHVKLCGARQQRILADVLPSLKENGLLIYATCSYSMQENEDICKWLEKEFGLINEKLTIQKEWGIVETDQPVAYRFFPDKVQGEGFFLACYRKATFAPQLKLPAYKIQKPSPQQNNVLKNWLNQNSKEMEVLEEDQLLFAWPKALLQHYYLFRSNLNIVYMGTALGEVMKNKLIPHHALALSQLTSEQIRGNELDYQEAILFLQKKELALRPPDVGWQLVCYKEKPLGWINALPSRINNYYPKQLRILKDSARMEDDN
ncbi:MAG: rRNA cytosine-C5-methyltransferase [Flavisolibacter sp.]